MASLYDSLLERLDGTEYNGYFAARCIFHDDSHPSMFVYEDGTFRCAACRKQGSLEYLAKRLGSVDIPVTRSQPSRVLPQWRSWERKHGDLFGISQYGYETVMRYPRLQGYFKKRKINEFISVGRFGYIDGWALFPVMNSEGQTVDIVVRAISKKGDSRYVVRPVADASGSRHLYVPNWKRVSNSKMVYVVFGIIDAWTLESLGLPCVTGITGKAIPLDRLKELHKKIIFVPDLGEDEDAHKYANQLGMGTRVKTLRYPDDCKDPNDIKINYGNDFLFNLIGV